jgi:hypothetical protein
MSESTKCTMCLSINKDTTYIEDPIHIPRIGEEVTAMFCGRASTGIVVSVSHDFGDENPLTDRKPQFISVRAR